MAKKSTNNGGSSSSNYSIVKLCAFFGLLLAGIAGVISFILNLLAKLQITIGWGGKVSGMCSLISQIAVFIAVWLAAWDYVKNKGKTWKVLFLIFFILSILGIVGIGIGTFI